MANKARALRALLHMAMVSQNAPVVCTRLPSVHRMLIVFVFHLVFFIIIIIFQKLHSSSKLIRQETRDGRSSLWTLAFALIAVRNHHGPSFLNLDLFYEVIDQQVLKHILHINDHLKAHLGYTSCPRTLDHRRLAILLELHIPLSD